MDKDLVNIQDLLNRIKAIDVRYAAVRKEREESGVLYNIFDVLGLTASEVGLHSSLIASLLRPDKHGAGRKFLAAFLKMPGLNLPEGFLNLDKVTVEQEKYIGPKKTNSGGRIDLFVTDGTNHIIIENKIYAGDQENQLLRYHNYRPEGKLVYLSLFEDDGPSKDSLGGLDPDLVTCISYKYDILQWLKECVQISANLPYIRETINQYIKTIQQLTDTEMGTNSEIIDLLRRPENMAAAFAIQENLNESMNIIMNGFIQDLKAELIRIGSPFTCITNESNWFQSYRRISFENEQWDKIKFSTEFEATGFKNMIAGLLRKEHVNSILEIPDAIVLSEKLGFTKKNKNWLWGALPSYIPSYWNNARVMKLLSDGSMVREFIKMLEVVSERSKGLDL